ncbi:hypothetical protein GCM10007918_09110 [Piscinibacter gummiphilus]|nr:hypothetical protein GCM10007918_09110 [Piscinibacter gummiphilus]
MPLTVKDTFIVGTPDAGFDDAGAPGAAAAGPVATVVEAAPAPAISRSRRERFRSMLFSMGPFLVGVGLTGGRMPVANGVPRRLLRDGRL